MAKSLAEVVAAAKKRANRSDQKKTVKPPQGTSTWRIMSGWDPADPNVFYHAYGQHWIKNIDPETGKEKVIAVVVCNRATFESQCDVCDALYPAIKGAESAGDNNAVEMLKEMRAGQQFLMNAYRTDITEPKVEILSVGSGLFGDIAATLGEYEDLLDPVKGQDIVITREGTGKNTTYGMVVRPMAKCKPTPDSLLLQKVNLSEYVQDDAAEKTVKALETIGHILASKPAAIPNGAFSKPVPALTLAEELNDSIPGLEDEDLEAIVDAEVVETEKTTVATATPAPETFGEDLDSDELAELLAKL